MTTTRSTIRKRLFAGATAAILLGSAAVVAIAPAAHAAECVGSTFTEDCELTVPVGMTELAFTVNGASGGGTLNVLGGSGALVSAVLPVTAGEVLQIRIGGPGGAGVGVTGGAGGVNGGGAGADGNCFVRGGSGGGGGYTAVFAPDGTTPLLIAGGGGGASVSRLGVAAGQNTDGTGTDGLGVTPTSLIAAGGGGGTLSAGGAGGDKATTASGNSGTAGSSLQGGNGGSTTESCAGSGGGGGYFGGGGGGASGGDGWTGGSGGSGSSFVDPSAISSSITTSSESGGGSVSYAEPVEITSTSPLPAGTTGTAYTPTTLSATGGTEPYAWSAGGTLPPGLTLDAGGEISGLPTASGTFTFDATVTDGTTSDTKPFSITIATGGGDDGGKQTQTAACVKPSTIKVKKTGASRLVPATCLTNAEKPVGVTAKARMARGDITLYRLACKQGSRFTPTKALPNGKGARYCSTGKLVVRTYGYSFNLRVNWFAPATSEFSAYKATRTFRLR